MKALLNKVIASMIKIGALALSLMIAMNLSAQETNDSLQEIKNFRVFTEQLASSGMPIDNDFTMIKHAGFKHVVNLIPGDFSAEKQVVESMQMSFAQIEVNWEQPKLQDFQTFVSLMQDYGDDKVLVHCKLNYRASAFAYLYQVTQQGIPQDQAMKTMHSVWQPEGVWLEFIESVLQHYQR
jgi:protein tyrosine phosphatase (PTP) superfamily phosphohydrolase (DUF442 family)